MNYRDKIRKAIECPQLGNDHYGEWGALRLDQRKYIKRLLDEFDSADAYILKLYEENQQLKEQQKEFIDYLEDMLVSELDIFTVVRVCDVLSKYKEITGGRLNEF